MTAQGQNRKQLTSTGASVQRREQSFRLKWSSRRVRRCAVLPVQHSYSRTNHVRGEPVIDRPPRIELRRDQTSAEHRPISSAPYHWSSGARFSFGRVTRGLLQQRAPIAIV